MDDFIRHMKREMILANIGAVIYAVICIGILRISLRLSFPVAMPFWLLSALQGFWAINEARKSMRSAKILDQARKQREEWEQG